MNFAAGSSLDNHERESRFLSLKIVADVLTYLLAEESIYVPHSALELSTPPAEPHSRATAVTVKINKFLVEGLLPLSA
jgi:hypothetical protein